MAQDKILLDEQSDKILTSPTITTPTGLVPNDVGLGNVDNTSDLDKPISTATAAALATKLGAADVGVTVASLDGTGKHPASESLVSSVHGRTGAVVGLAGDYDAAKIAAAPAGNLIANTAQAQIYELDLEKIPETDKGAINGVASLDGSGWVPLSQLPPSVTTGGVSSVNTQTGAVVLDTDDISDATATNKYTTAADIAKLAGIEANATADQTGAEIKALYEAEADTNAYTDADKAKVDFVTVTQAVDLDAMETDIAEHQTLTGVADGSTNLGTFTGSVITDNETIKGALQDIEDNSPLNNFTATADPNATNDSTQGYSVGSKWVNTSNNTVWEMLSSTPLFAVWANTNGSGGASEINDLADGYLDLATNSNVGLGSTAYSITTGLANILVGQGAGTSTTTGRTNVAIGNNAMFSNTTGQSNTGVGNGSMLIANGDQNTALGENTLWRVTGQQNVAIGNNAMFNGTTVNQNTAVGSSAFGAFQNGVASTGNTALGFEAGSKLFDNSNLTSAQNSTFLGTQTRGSAVGVDNEIVIGYQAEGKGSNTAVLGKQGTVTDVYLAGNVHFNEAFTLPNTDGTAGQVPQTDGAGNVTWQTVGGGGGTDTLDFQTGITGTVVTLPSTPLASRIPDVYRNGLLQNPANYTLVGTTLTFTTALVAADQVITRYDV